MGFIRGLRHVISLTEGAQGGSVKTPYVPREPAELALGVKVLLTRMWPEVPHPFPPKK